MGFIMSNVWHFTDNDQLSWQEKEGYFRWGRHMKLLDKCFLADFMYSPLK